MNISIYLFPYIHVTRQNTSTCNITMIFNLTELLGTWNFLQSSYNYSLTFLWVKETLYSDLKKDLFRGLIIDLY